MSLDKLHKCLEAALCKKFLPILNPQTTINYPAFVKSIIPIDSKKDSFIQITDVIMGSIGYLQNGLFKKAEAKKAKVSLMKYIFEKVALSGAIKIEGKNYYVAKSTKFNIWLFRPNKKTS